MGENVAATAVPQWCSAWGPARLVFGREGQGVLLLGMGGQVGQEAPPCLSIPLSDSKWNDIAKDCKRVSVLPLKACPAPCCQRAVGGKRLAAHQEIIQLNSIRVHQ